MLKLLWTLLGLIIMIFNVTIIIYISWLKTYNVNWELPSFYKYMFLDEKIKKDFEDLQGQNVLVEKGSNRIVKIQNYILSTDSICSGFLLKKWKKWKINFENEKIWSLIKKHKDIEQVVLQKFGDLQIQAFITLKNKELQILNKSTKNFIQGKYPEVY